VSSLEVRNLVKRLGGSLIVDGVSFRVEEGEFFVLLGPSGSGKTTLLRLICGLEQPDSGQVIIADKDVTRLPPRERNLGMVFQDYGLYPNMNVYQNIAYGLEARGMGRTEVDRRVRASAQMLGLFAFLERPIVDLSGGEQQRVALARALAKDADAYLFDEPLSNLDPKLRYQARRDIMTLHREKAMPSLYVTHDQTEAFAMADRIAVMANARLQQVGTPNELLNHPANIYVARFTGTPSMNLLDARIENAGGSYSVHAAGLSIGLPQRWSRALAGQAIRDVVLGFRPNAVMLADAAGIHDFEVQPFSGQIESIQELVMESIAVVHLNERSSVAVVLEDSTGLDVGNTVQLAVDVNRICLFDSENGEALKHE
jgi:multiple sugar transport system ATP-binding protein